MTTLPGPYIQIGSINLENFYAAIDASNFFGTIKQFTEQDLVITCTNDIWTIMIYTDALFHIPFKLGIQFSGVLGDLPGRFQSVANLHGENLTIECFREDLGLIVRTYEPTKTGCILTLTDPKSGVYGKRIFHRREMKKPDGILFQRKNHALSHNLN